MKRSKKMNKIETFCEKLEKSNVGKKHLENQKKVRKYKIMKFIKT